MIEEVRERVLVSAYACDPTRGSEPGAGWAIVKSAAAGRHAIVLTRTKNRASIENELERSPDPNLEFVYLDLPHLVRRLKGRVLPTQIYYLLWQFRARRECRAIASRVAIALVHHATFAVDWLPAGVIYKGSPPAVWGPVGGSTLVPRRLWRYLGMRGVVSEVTHTIATRIVGRLLTYGTRRHARVIIVQNHDVASRVHGDGTVIVAPNVVVEMPAEVTGDVECNSRQILAVGRLMPLKGIALLLHALAHPLLDSYSLSIIGEGSDHTRLVHLAARLGVEDRCRFEGVIPRAEVLQRMGRAGVVVHPSLREAAGFAIAEAVAVGRPVVAFSHGGPAVILRSRGESALVDVNSPTVVDDFARAIVDAAGQRWRPSKEWSSSRITGLVCSAYDSAIRE